MVATFPYDTQFSTDPDVAHLEVAKFMQRAQNAIVDAGLLGIDRTKLANVEAIMAFFDLESADMNERGYVVPVTDRDCAERLLAAKLLDQTQWEIIQRWGAVHPMNPAP